MASVSGTGAQRTLKSASTGSTETVAGWPPQSNSGTSAQLTPNFSSLIASKSWMPPPTRFVV
jgi:hypothetical protein